MIFITYLSDFYLSAPWHPIILVICFWLLWPGAMFFVAAVFESRPVYLGKGQSRMFFPGDFLLGTSVVMLLGMYTKETVGWHEVYLPSYWIVTGIFHFVLACILHIPDAGRYKEAGSRRSPTKLTHDFFGYFLCPWLMASRGIPQLVWLIMSRGSVSCWIEWIVVFIPFSGFMVFTVYDIKHAPTDEERLLMHPATYAPCWKNKDTLKKTP